MAFVPDKPRFIPDSTLGDVVPQIGAAEGVGSVLTGAVSAPIAGIAGGAASLIPGLREGVGADVVRRVSDMFTYQPRSETGRGVASTIAAPFEWLAKKADVAGEKTLDVTGSPLAATTVNTAIQSAPLVAGRLLSKYGAAGESAESAAARASTKSLNAPRDAAITSAIDKGIGISPAEANPSLLNKFVEGFSGQAKTQQLQSVKNQPMFQNVVRRALGINKDTPLSIESMEAVRRGAGKMGYEPIRKTGDIVIDEQYGAALDKVESKYKGAARSFAEETDPVQKAVDSARKTVRAGVFDASDGIDKIILERARADKAFRAGDAELGKAHKAIADTIEAQVERSLQAGGPSRTLADLRAARELIAKSYDVQKAIKGNEIDIRILASQLKKGRPLTGDIRELAEFGQRFPGSSQAGMKNAPVVGSWGDIGMGGMGALATLLYHGAGTGALGPAGAVALGAGLSRPVIRSAITSGPYQNLMVRPPSYGRSSLDILREEIAKRGMGGGLAAFAAESEQR